MNNRAKEFIIHRSKYIEPDGKSLFYYQEWINGETEKVEKFPNKLRKAALNLLKNNDEAIVRSAIQALACIGVMDDAEILALNLPDEYQVEVHEAINLINKRHKSIEELLDDVTDSKTFQIFAEALANERENASAIENSNPRKYKIDGAHNWKNADISSFIYSGLVHIQRISNKENPTWKDMANFLYMGKIYE